MAMNDNAVLKVGNGHFYTADVGTERPADLLDLGTEWSHMGHTSLEDILAASIEGGDRTQLGSLQNPNLRTNISSRSESFTINLLQFDTDSLSLYYGANSVVLPNGDVEVPETPVPEERAWLFLFFDGESAGGLYATRASFIAAEAFSISDTESLSTLPLTVTPLRHGSSQAPYRFIPPHTVTTGGD